MGNDNTTPNEAPPSLSENVRFSQHLAAKALDLCLYRVVADRCGGRILPFGVRQMIKDYAWASFDNETLREAVRLWCCDRELALERYGEINDWDVSRVTFMDSLFRNTQFNDRIDRWGVGNVSSMRDLFFSAIEFNQPLNTWDVRRVTDMSGLFRGAWAFNQPLDTWDVRRVTSMNEMFHRAVAFNQPLCTWDVRAVANMSHMFDRAVSFNQSLDTWDVGQATDRRDMFEGAASYQGAPQDERRDCAQKPTRRMGKRSTGGLRNEVGGQTLSTGVDEG